MQSNIPEARYSLLTVGQYRETVGHLWDTRMSISYNCLYIKCIGSVLQFPCTVLQFHGSTLKHLLYTTFADNLSSPQITTSLSTDLGKEHQQPAANTSTAGNGLSPQIQTPITEPPQSLQANSTECDARDGAVLQPSQPSLPEADADPMPSVSGSSTHDTLGCDLDDEDSLPTVNQQAQPLPTLQTKSWTGPHMGLQECIFLVRFY